MLYCQRCGAGVSNGTVSCPNCGTKVSSLPEAPGSTLALVLSIGALLLDLIGFPIAYAQFSRVKTVNIIELLGNLNQLAKLAKSIFLVTSLVLFALSVAAIVLSAIVRKKTNPPEGFVLDGKGRAARICSTFALSLGIMVLVIGAALFLVYVVTEIKVKF